MNDAFSALLFLLRIHHRCTVCIHEAKLFKKKKEKKSCLLINFRKVDVTTKARIFEKFNNSKHCHFSRKDRYQEHSASVIVFNTFFAKKRQIYKNREKGRKRVHDTW